MAIIYSITDPRNITDIYRRQTGDTKECDVRE